MTRGSGSIAAAGEAPGASSFVLFLVKPRSHAMRVVWLVGALATATLITQLRLQIGLGSSGVPLVFFLPAIIIVALIAGLEYGFAALVLSIAIVWFAFIPPPFTFQIPPRAQAITFALWSVVSIPLVVLAYALRASLQLLQRSEQRYRQLVSVTSDVVWITDGDGNVHQAHPSWTRVTGVAWPDYQNRGWLRSVHEEDRPALRPADTGAYHAAEFRLWDGAADDWRWYRSRAVPLRGPDGEIEEWVTTMRDAHDAKLARERRELMIGEGRHRLKNLVTIIDALAKSSRQRASVDNPELDGFLKRFLGRLHALGAAADLVLAGNHMSVEIGAIIRATLAPFTEENANRYRIEGPAIQLSEPTGGGLALAVHELATNAIKYGALSAPDGNVSIGWTCVPVTDGERVIIEWKEHGGPKPVAPEKEGFGSRVIKSVPAREKNGEVAIEYQPDGLYCRIAFVKARDPGEQATA
jgi:PAS domain S-box-containing protein